MAKMAKNAVRRYKFATGLFFRTRRRLVRILPFFLGASCSSVAAGSPPPPLWQKSPLRLWQKSAASISMVFAPVMIPLKQV